MSRKIIDDEFLHRLESLSYHMGVPMRGFFGGNHRTKSYGSTVEFADFREYVLGDDLRYIDWNLYSRFEKHFIKLFVDERQMVTQVFVDCSASMAKIDPNKATYALRIAAAFGYLAIHSLDKVSFQLLHQNSTEEVDGTFTGKDAYYRAVKKLEDVKFKGEVDIEKSILSAIDIGSNDGICVIISDFLTENNWKKAVDYLLYKKKQVMLVQVLSPSEINPSYNGRVQLVDCEATHVLDDRNMKLKITKSHIDAYKKALSDYQDEIKQFCASRGVHFLSASSDEKIEKLIFEKLEQVGTVK